MEELAWVLVLGLDQRPRQRVEVTALIAIPRRLQQDDGSGEKPFFVASAVGDTIFDAMNLLNCYVSRRINLTHAKAVVMGMDTAEQGIQVYLDGLSRDREARRIMSVLISHGPAGEFIRAIAPRIEANPGKYMEELIANRQFTGFYEPSLVHDILVAIASPAEEPVAIRAALSEGPGRPGQETAADVGAGEVPRRGGDPVELIGGVVFSGDRAVGTLTGDEMRAVAMVRGTFRRASVTVPQPGEEEGWLALALSQRSPPRISVDLGSDPPRLRTRISLEADILMADDGFNYSGQETIVRLQQQAARVLKERIEAVVRRAQEEFQADIFGFGRHVQPHFLTWPQWQDYRWLQRFPEAVIEVEVNLEIRRIGLLFREHRPRGAETR